MPSAMLLEIPATWGRFLEDVDTLEVIPRSARGLLDETAGPESALFEKYRLYIRHAGVVTPPESYAERLVELLPGDLTKLHLLLLEPHDLALTKLDRNNAVDREDVRLLARRVPLDPAILRDRYRRGDGAGRQICVRFRVPLLMARE